MTYSHAAMQSGLIWSSDTHIILPHTSSHIFNHMNLFIVVLFYLGFFFLLFQIFTLGCLVFCWYIYTTKLSKPTLTFFFSIVVQYTNKRIVL